MNPKANGHLLLGPEQGEVIEARGARIVIKAASASQLVCEYTAPAEFVGPPLHIHPGFDETFIVTEGLLQVRIKDEVTELARGAVAYVTGTVPHTFANPSAARTRFLVVCSPGGFEHFFRAVARGDQDGIAAISERFGYRPLEAAA